MLRTPKSASRNKGGTGSSWFCETIDSRVFSQQPPPPSVTSRPWVGSNRAGAARERVSSSALAASHFYQSAPPRAEFPNDGGKLMSSILYGREGEKSTRRTKAPASRLYSNAAGHATARESAETAGHALGHIADRHPHVQVAIKAESTRRVASSEISDVVFNQHGESATGATGAADVPTYRRIYGRAPGTAQREEREGTAHELMYVGERTEASQAAAAAAAFAESVTPRKLRGPSREPTSTTAGNLHSYIFPGDGPHGADPHFDLTSEPLAAGGREKGWAAEPLPTSKRTFRDKSFDTYASGGVGGALATWCTDPAEAANSTLYLATDDAMTAERQLKRGSGAYHPLSGHLGAATAAGINLVGAAAEPRSPGHLDGRYADALLQRNHRPNGGGHDAGVPSDRLHTLKGTAGAVTVGRPAETSPLARRKVGVLEGRAGTGPRLTTERPLTVQSRKSVDVHAVGSIGAWSARNPILGETSEISPERRDPERASGKLQLCRSPSARDHLGGTLVPGAFGSGRRVGKATAGYESVSAATFTIAPAPPRAAEAPAEMTSRRADASGSVVAAGATPARNLRRSNSWSCGRRHIGQPTHEPRPFDLSHRAHEPSREPAVPAVPTGAAAPSWQPPPLLRTESSTNRQLHPPPLKAESSRVHAEATQDYNQVRHRGTTSNIFSNLSYA